MRPLLTRFYGDAEYAKALYSDYSTGAVTMFNMPIVLISPIACAIVPFISSAVAKQKVGEAKSLMSTALRMTSIIAMPCALGLSVLSSPILTLVFRGDSDMAQNAADLLSVLGISVFFVGMLSVTNAVLQANRLEKKPIISMLFGILVKVSSSFFLIGRLGEIGAPLSTLLFYITVVTFNFIFVIKNLGIRVNFAFTFIRPLSASLICALSALGVYRFLFARLGLTLSTLIAICVAVLIYAVSIFLFKCITKDDIAVLPKGERIGKILTKMKLI
jgi:stage V sporulation protein B